MRLISVSVFSILFVMPAIAGVRLPTVDVAGAVSARAAFGAPIEKTMPKQVSKKVVARTTTKAPAANIGANNALNGGDILLPNRPSDNLWASSDAPLRMPRSEEFAVLRSDAFLPEERLDVEPVATLVSVPTQDTVATSEIDEQIARLNELQRRADASVADNKPIRISSPIVASEKQEPIKGEPKISRMVVPMERDVIVRTVENATSPRIASVRDDMTKMSPTELRKAFRKTFLSENKHLSAYQIDNKFDVASDMSNFEGFTAQHDLSENGGIRPLEIKIKFRNDDSALSRDNYNLLTEYAGIVVNNPKRAIQVGIPRFVTTNADDRKLAARRLAIVEQVLRDTGVAEQRIMPVLSSRDDSEGFVLRIISSDQYDTLTQQHKNMFGDTVSKKTYKSMSW